MAATLGSAACSGAEHSSATEHAILGGADAPADAAVVAIVNFSGGQCSGSLITPELVLTARHCIADTAGRAKTVQCGASPFEPADSAGAIFVVPLPEISSDPNDYLRISEVRMPADLGDDLCGTDVVVLRLKQPLLNITPLVPRLDEPVRAGERYSAVGFGLDESLPDKPSGVRKRLDELMVTCNGSECDEADVRDNEWVGSGGPCSGDSGGPALDADGRVIGVVSRGKDGCRAPVFGDVATRADWLVAEAIAAANAQSRTPPAWAPCSEINPCAVKPPAEEPPAEEPPAEEPPAEEPPEPAAAVPPATCSFRPIPPLGGAGGLSPLLGCALGMWLCRMLGRRPVRVSRAAEKKERKSGERGT